MEKRVTHPTYLTPIAEVRRAGKEQLIAGNQENGNAPVAYWMRLTELRQEILDDLVSIYCNSYAIEPEAVQMVPDLEGVVRSITGSLGFYEARIAGANKPSMEIVRKVVVQSGLNGVLVSFRAGINRKQKEREVFQTNLDDYLTQVVGLARPLNDIK